MKRRPSRRIVPGLRRKGETDELAARLAPLEEQTKTAQPNALDSGTKSGLVTQQNGAIVIGGNKLPLPKDVVEIEPRPGIEPVVVIIVGLLLAYTLFIAWQVSQMQ
jgi:hypothetical protein